MATFQPLTATEKDLLFAQEGELVCSTKATLGLREKETHRSRRKECGMICVVVSSSPD